jgi:hypothetical protein
MNLILNLKSLLTQTKYNVYDSLQINMYEPNLTKWVDLVLETENYYICFKDIWTWNNLTGEIINDYLNKSEQVNLLNNNNSLKKYIFILLVKNNNLDYSNQILNQKNIHIIEKSTQNKLINEICTFLYYNNIYIYDYDDSIIMLE